MQLNYISEIVTFQVALYLILCNVLRGRLKRYFYICPILSLLLIILLETTKYNNILFLISDFSFYFIFPCLFIENIKKRKIVITSLTFIGLFSLSNIVIFFISSFINTESASTGIVNVIFDVILLILLCYLTISKKFYKITCGILSLSKHVKIVLLSFVWELIILASLLTVLLLQYKHIPIISLSCFLIIVILVISFGAFYLLITNDLKNTYYKKINNKIRTDMNKQVLHYERISIANDKLRKFRHDFNNLKIGLNTYLKANDTIGALNYLNDCDMLIETGNEILHTGHHIVDALFSDKMQLTKENNISIKFEGLIPTDILTPVDLCIIFGNTLDNAIEACFKIENNTEKVINVTVKQNHDYIFVTFTNPCVENVEIKNNTVLTTKQNTEMHGIGLYSIKQVLKSYDGHLTLHCENNIFTTEIDFCIST